MNSRIVQVIYGLSLLILVPIGGYLFFSNRTLTQNTNSQFDRLNQVEDRLKQIETQGKPQTSGSTDSKPSTQGEASPTPAQINELRPKADITVLNARGTAGLASKFRTRLTDLGYKVGKVDNAPSQKDSVIKVKPGFEPLAKVIQGQIKDLNNFPKIETDSGAESTIVIIIGQQ